MKREAVEQPVAFLSHQWSDKDTARAAGTRLARLGVEPILDEWSFRRGRSLPQEIETSMSTFDLLHSILVSLGVDIKIRPVRG